MVTGIFAGIMWALETVVLGLAFSADFLSKGSLVLLAPFICTFLHDAFSAVYMWLFTLLKGEGAQLFSLFRSPDFKWLVAASAIGGPIGMTGYVMAVNYMGASVGAVASAVYPAIGSLLAFIFLKEKITLKQWIFLVLTLLGVFGISYSPQIGSGNALLGLLGAFMCAFGWGTEGVVLSKCLKNNIKSEHALVVRQTTSAVVYGAVIMPLIGGYGSVGKLFAPQNLSVLAVVALAALCATVSYIFYYKTIAARGVAKAMALNITYTAWAMLFSVVLLGDFSVLNPLTIGCGLAVLICGILSACDIKQLFKTKNKCD